MKIALTFPSYADNPEPEEEKDPKKSEKTSIAAKKEK